MKVEAVVFDLGRVLYNFDFAPVLEFARSQGAKHHSLSDFAEAIDQAAYERGEISSEEFIRRVQSQIPKPISADEVAARWQRIFEPCADMLELLQKLLSEYKVIILSNTNELHWTHLQREYDIESLAHGTITSFQIGCLKPDAAIYREAEAKFTLKPERTVFIDDIAANAEGARACGWHGIHHTGFASTAQQLRSIGVKIN